MKKAIFLLVLCVLLVTQAAFAQKATRKPSRVQDPNVPSGTGPGTTTMTVPGADIMERAFGQAMENQAQSDTNLCAVVVLPGPASGFDIRFGGLQCGPRPSRFPDHGLIPGSQGTIVVARECLWYRWSPVDGALSIGRARKRAGSARLYGLRPV